MKSWWMNQHYNRPGGVESGSATAWVPQSKPFWFMEVGCPAVDKGANQPNAFVDRKSSESTLPYYSRGLRDDLIQARFMKAFRDAFDWTKPGYVSGLNSVSTVNGQRMVNLDHIHAYCWDARPYPAFPNATAYWSDGDNWRLGHWLNGRIGSASLDELVGQILRDSDFDDFDVSVLAGVVPGYVIDRTMSARDAIQPLELAYFFDSVESEGKIAFRHRGNAAPGVSVLTDTLVEEKADEPLYQLTRGQETELPASAKVRYISGIEDYEQAVAEARRLTGASGRVSEASLPIVLDDNIATAIAESWLYETWAARERAKFKLPPSLIALEPGDVISAEIGGRSRLLRLTEVADRGVRDIDVLTIDPDVYTQIEVAPRTSAQPAPVQAGPPAVALLDIPAWNPADPPQSGYVAAMQKPCPGSVAVFSSPQTTGYQLRAVAGGPATLGVTLDALESGPEAVLDRHANMRVRISSGALVSVDDLTLLGGANLAAFKSAVGEWELIQFQNATLVDVLTYRLSGLLRAQFGSEGAIAPSLAAGAQFVLLDAALARVALLDNDLRVQLNWRCGPGNRGIGDASYFTTPFTYTGRGLRPFSPVHVKGARSAGDLTMSWIRRTRSGGDNWEAPDVPLGEESESYEVDILAGSVVKRTLSVATNAALYTAAQQTADFGSVQSSVSVKVFQTNATYGRGTPRAATI